ncbi:transposase [Staphylococcus aureus]|nr:transposase [Staphylococcus aureus]
MSVREINKVKRKLGVIIIRLNIRKIVAQRAIHNKIDLKKLISIK